MRDSKIYKNISKKPVDVAEEKPYAENRIMEVFFRRGYTIKGKGVSVFENQVRFHGGQPTSEEWETAYTELNGKIAELEG